MNKSRDRTYSGKKRSSQRKSHIIQQALNKKNQLIDKYQSQTQSLLDQIDDSKMIAKKSVNNSLTNSPGNFRMMKRNRLSSSYRNQTNQTDKDIIVSGSMKDYQKVILGLEYALQSQRKKVQTLSQKNNSLQLQISNLRNVLVGPNQAKQYEKTIMKQMQDKVNNLQDKLLDQKKNYQFIIESKNQAITSLQSQLRTLQKDYQNKLGQKDKLRQSAASDNGLTKKILDLMLTIQQQRNTITQKNILIQSLKYRKIQFHGDQGDESDDQIKKIRKIDKMKFYLQQLETANKMIIKKNIQILNLGIDYIIKHRQ